jgi:capsular exopolysaccharide synthesis family protein
VEEHARHGPTLFESLWRYRVVVVAVPLLAGVLGYVLASQQSPTYVASARLYLTDPTTTPGVTDGGFTVGIDPNEYVPQQAARAGSTTVLQTARDALPEAPSLQELRESIEIESSIEDLALTVYAEAGDPDRAAEVANVVATAFQQVNEEQEQSDAAAAVFEIELEITDLQAQLDELAEQLEDEPENLALQSQIENLSARLIEREDRVSTVKIEARLRGDGVDQFEPAEVPDEPASPRPRLTALIFAFLAAVGTALWAYWYAGVSQRVLSRGDPEAVLGVPLLGEIPLYRTSGDDPLTPLLRVDPAAAEAYEFVLSSMEFALADVGGQSLMITSTLPGDGKSTTALQLAIAASRDKRRVVIVDADIRARGLTTVLGAEDRVGLSDLAALDLQPAEVVRRYRFSEQSQIPVVTAGQRRGDPAALLRTAAFRRAMQALKETAELLIVDSSPLLAVADATIVAGSVDGLVLVVSHGTPVGELQKVRERLKFVSTPLLGYVFNRSDATTAAAYGYGYGVAEDDEGQPRLVPRAAVRAARSRSRRTKVAAGRDQ